MAKVVAPFGAVAIRGRICNVGSFSESRGRIVVRKYEIANRGDASRPEQQPIVLIANRMAWQIKRNIAGRAPGSNPTFYDNALRIYRKYWHFRLHRDIRFALINQSGGARDRWNQTGPGVYPNREAFARLEGNLRGIGDFTPTNDPFILPDAGYVMWRVGGALATLALWPRGFNYNNIIANPEAFWLFG